MAQFYLNIRDGHDLVRDSQGYDFPCAQAARDAAVRSLREMAPGLRAKLERRNIEIADATGHAIAVVHAYDAIPPAIIESQQLLESGDRRTCRAGKPERRSAYFRQPRSFSIR